MHPETAYAIARISQVTHELSQPMSHRHEANRIIADARRARWNTVVEGLGRLAGGRRRRVTRAAAVARA
jgi:hypothetical protein